jgi:uncharacterized membrane protein YGL010W
LTKGNAVSDKHFNELVHWQWDAYHLYHASRINLFLHIVFVPLFMWSNTACIASILDREWFTALAALIIMVLAFAAQALGHRVETMPSIAFSGVSNALKRVFIEQVDYFPKICD